MGGGVGVDDEVDEHVVGVEQPLHLLGPAEREGALDPVVGGPHVEPRHRGADDRVVPAQLLAQRRAPHVGHEEEGALAVGEGGQLVRGLQRRRVHGREHGAHLVAAHDEGGQRLGRLPVGRRDDRVHRVGGRALEQEVTDALQPPSAHAAAGGQLVGVPGRARRRELVDEREHQLRELRQRPRPDPVVDGDAGQLAPGDARTDPVRREERLHRPPAARLAPAQVVGPRFDAVAGVRGSRRAPAAPEPETRATKPPSASCTACRIVVPIGPDSAFS
ncbi:hypothetical protein [Nocardioides zeae]